MDPSRIYEIQAGPYWDWKIAVDLFFGGAGVGALLLAVALDRLFDGRYQRILQTAAWLSPVLVLLGLSFLLLELGQPSRLPLTFTHFAPTSPLWWGGVFQLLLVFGGVAYALKTGERTAGGTGRRWLGWALVPIAIIVGAYHGMLLAVVTARPLWNTGPTVVAAMLGFASTGIAAVMVTHLIRMKVAGRLVEGEHLAGFLEDMELVRNVLTTVLALQLGTFFLWWLSLDSGTLGDQRALVVANDAYGPLFWWLGIGLGLVLPLGLGGYSLWQDQGTQRMRHLNTIWLISALTVLIGGFFFRLTVVLGGQVGLPVPTLS